MRRSVRMALWLAVACGILAMAVAANGEGLLRLTGQDAEVSRQAGRFLEILLWATIPNIMAGVLRNFVSALGRPVFATAITALAIAVNAAINSSSVSLLSVSVGSIISAPWITSGK